MPNQTGSPLEARQNPLVYTVILYLAIAIFIIFAIWVLLKIIKKKHSSPEWIEAHKKQPTKQADVIRLSKVIGLSNEERLLLTRICREQKMPNIFYSYTDSDALDDLFKRSYLTFKGIPFSTNLIYSLFRLKFHIEQYIISTKSIASSHSIPLNTVFTYVGKSQNAYQLKMVKNQKEGIILTIPKNLDESEDKPEPLSKISLSFTTTSNTQYTFETRLVRDNKVFDGTKQVLVAHSNTITSLNRRQYKRLELDVPCKYSAVEVFTNKKGDPDLRPKENKYDGKLANISSSGCCLISNYPIKEQQYIYIETTLPPDKDIVVSGLITGLRQNKESGLYDLHVVFIKLPVSEQVKILSSVYGYE